MQMFLTFLAVLTIAAAAPNVNPENAARRALPALEHEGLHDEFKQYALRHVTAEGTDVTERGRLVPTADNAGYVLVTEGEVSYIGDDGKTYVKVEGSHLPVAPEPIPAEVPVTP